MSDLYFGSHLMIGRKCETFSSVQHFFGFGNWTYSASSWRTPFASRLNVREKREQLMRASAAHRPNGPPA